MPDALAELLGKWLRILGQPMRLRLVDRLRDGMATNKEPTRGLDAVQQKSRSMLPLFATPASWFVISEEHTSIASSLIHMFSHWSGWLAKGSPIR